MTLGVTPCTGSVQFVHEAVWRPGFFHKGIQTPNANLPLHIQGAMCYSKTCSCPKGKTRRSLGGQFPLYSSSASSLWCSTFSLTNSFLHLQCSDCHSSILLHIHSLNRSWTIESYVPEKQGSSPEATQSPIPLTDNIMENSRSKEVQMTTSQVVYEGELPCPCYISLSFPRPEPIEHLVFQNYYTGSITIKQYITDLDSYRTVLKDFKLTNWPHFENDAENWYIISTSMFRGNYDASLLKELRIYLTQPSPNWKSFGLKNINCFKIVNDQKGPSEKPRTRFSLFKSTIRNNLSQLNSSSANEPMTYEETMNGTLEVNRLELGQG